MTDLLPASQLWALAVFAIASFTDFLDGYLAGGISWSPTLAS